MPLLLLLLLLAVSIVISGPCCQSRPVYRAAH
jgi:hypothetical protein